MLSTRRCFVQGDTTASHEVHGQRLQRLEEASDSRHSQGLKAKKAADEAHNEALDDLWMGLKGKFFQADHRAADEKRTAAKDFQVAKADEVEAKEAKAVIQGPSSESQTPKVKEPLFKKFMIHDAQAKEPLFKKFIHEAQARTLSKKSTRDASTADMRAINSLIMVTVVAGLGFLAWRFIRKKTKKATDSNIDAFQESLLNPSQDDNKFLNTNDTDSTDSTNSNVNSISHSISCIEDGAPYIGTPSTPGIPGEITLERDFSICKTYDEHIKSLNPETPSRGL